MLSLERMNRILDLNPDDETAVVEPGVINADLNAAAAVHGLMYAPDPASFRISTIGGNVATNAGGLRCAKYGVTRDSVLALDVVLADGSLIHTGHQTFKGVAGYDLTGLFVGSEGTLGIVVGVTVRLKYLPREVHTIAAFYPDFRSAAAGVLAVGKARVQPAIMELLDGGIAAPSSTNSTARTSPRGALAAPGPDGRLRSRRGSRRRPRVSLAAGGAVVTTEASAEAEQLVELRRNSRGVEVDDQYRVGEDVAVPRSRLVDYVAALEAMAAAHGVQLKVVAHAGDGNLHPTFWVDRVEDRVDAGRHGAAGHRPGRVHHGGPGDGRHHHRRARDRPVQAALARPREQPRPCGNCSAGSRTCSIPPASSTPAKRSSRRPRFQSSTSGYSSSDSSAP